MKTSHLLVAALFASVAGASMAQSTTPPQGAGGATAQPNVTPRMPAGQQSSQGTPMGETGTQRPGTPMAAPAPAPMAAPAPAPMPMAASPAPAPRMRADRN